MPRASREAGFRLRVVVWAKKLRVAPRQIRIQPMTRKWASCSATGRVTFSRELLHKPHDFQTYVIVHELLHLRLANHGKLFRASLRAHLGHNRWLARSVPSASRQRDQ
ncbi:MAG: M48 family peptidase [Rhodanobacteraceae bacterium]|nr:MAG: M48 family peptidase [Rhodanobacteraceae bacterium]